MSACFLVTYVLFVIAPNILHVCWIHCTCSVYTCCFSSRCFGRPFSVSCLLAVFVGHCRGFLLFVGHLLLISVNIFSQFLSAIFLLFLSAVFLRFLSAAFLFLLAVLLSVLVVCSSHLFSIPATFFIAPIIFLSAVKLCFSGSWFPITR